MEKVLRVWNIINFGKIKYYKVKDEKSAIVLIEQLIDQQVEDEDITDNVFGLEEYDSLFIDDDCDGWIEYYNEDGLDIMEIIDYKNGRDL